MLGRVKRIPEIKRDNSLLTRLIPVILVGADSVLDKESKLYICLLARLVDKAFSEYLSAKEYLDEEIKDGNKLAYGFSIINHLENCLNAINRVIRNLDVLINGVKEDGKIIKRQINIVDFVSEETLEKIKKYKVSDVRNRVEHIDEDIYLEKIEGGLSLTVDDKYQKICINNECITLLELVRIIEDYHNFILEIFRKLPNRIENGKYYYDKKQI